MDGISPTEIFTTLTGMAGATKAVAETLKALKGKVKGNAAAEKDASEAFEQISTLQSQMIDLQTRVLRLQQELSAEQQQNVQLRAQIGHEEKRAAERKQYTRKEIRGSVVLVREGEPNTYYCQACFETKNQEILLQRMPRTFAPIGTHKCPGCKVTYDLH